MFKNNMNITIPKQRKPYGVASFNDALFLSTFKNAVKFHRTFPNGDTFIPLGQCIPFIISLK